jgi:hypothetical protein
VDQNLEQMDMRLAEMDRQLENMFWM